MVQPAAGGWPARNWVFLYIAAGAMEHFQWAFIQKTPSVITCADHGVFRVQGRVLERAARAPLIQFEEGDFFGHLQQATAGTDQRLVNLLRQLLDAV
jgi:hypothetical protein